MKTTIVTKNAPILRHTARPVPIRDISSKKIQSVLKRMKIALKREDDGVAIAAPQIGESLRIFIISGRVQAIINNPLEKKRFPDTVFINPEITKLSKEKIKVEEGCLSVPGFYEKVKRAEHIRVKALNKEGQSFEFEARDLLAVCVQHEMDHLNGKLFVDYISSLKRQRIKKKLEKIHKMEKS